MAIEGTPTDTGMPDAPRRLRPLRQIVGWGGMAAIALLAVVLTTRTQAGAQRLQLALGFASEPERTAAPMLQPPQRAAATDAETQRLAAQVAALAADRERLIARIASLERSLGEVTGAVKQPAPAPAPVPAAQAAPAAPPAVVSAPPLSPPILLGMSPLAMPAARTEMPTPPASQPVPLPPVRIAAAPAIEPATATPPKPEFGIDLGGGASLEVLRNHWAAVKGNYGALLTGLHPVAVQRARHPSGVDYRLVVGPLPSVAAATQLCARFPITPTGCRPARFAGAYLAEP